MSKLFDQKKIMTYETIIILTITLTTATIAWFVAKNTTKVSGLKLKAASSDYIKVALTPDGDDVLELNENDRYIQLSLEELTNVTEGKLAPGTYGSLKLYVTSLNSEADHYRIAPNMQCEFMNGLTISDADKKKIKNMISGHVLFFANRTRNINENEQYIYSSPLMSIYDPLDSNTEKITLESQTGTLNEVGVEKEIELFWTWPYSIEEIPSELLPESYNPNKLAPEQIYDCYRYDASDTSFANYSKQELYDYADTTIATYVNDIVLKVKIEGYHYEE